MGEEFIGFVIPTKVGIQFFGLIEVSAWIIHGSRLP